MQPPFPDSIERELIGVCKQSMLQLRQQLRQYINELHKEWNMHDVDPVILVALLEVGTLLSSSNDGDLFNDGLYTQRKIVLLS